MIPYGRQDISAEDIESVVRVLTSEYLTQGPMTGELEAALCGQSSADYCVVCNSGTSALHLACRALGLGPGDSLWTSPISFVASANCALYCGAGVDFVDIDPDTFNMSVPALENKLREAAAAGRLPKIVVPVHMGGLPCDMRELRRLSDQYGFRIIEDASHALGSSYQTHPTGSCRYSDIAVFSFHPVKILTTAEGGAAMTNDPDLAERMALLRTHGVTRDPDLMDQSPEGDWYYQQTDLGFNYRMTDLQAALGCSQLRRLDEFIRRRREIEAHYDQLLVDLPVRSQCRADERGSSMHLYIIRVGRSETARTRREVFDHLRAGGIGVNVHYIPIHTQPFYRRLGFGPGYCPNAEAYYQEAISLPIFFALKDRQVEYVVRKLEEALS